MNFDPVDGSRTMNGVSVRTVAAEISHLVTQLGAPSRAAATLALRGGTQTSELSPYAPDLRSVHEP
jgi:hypothetical protein